MRFATRILLSLVPWLFIVQTATAADITVACNDQAGYLAALTAANPGDRILVVANSAGQCNLTMAGFNIPKKTYAHPTTEAAATTTLSGDGVGSCSMTNQGASYTIAPQVRFAGGGGRGATGHITISGGLATGCVVDTPGSKYTKPPTAVIYSPENFITVETDQYASLPAIGRRYDPTSHTTLSPKLTLTGTNPITVTAGAGLYDGSANWIFRGFEIHMTNAATVSVMAALSTSSHIWFIQNYIYPDPCPNSTPPYNTNARITFAANAWDPQFIGNYMPCWYGLPPGGTAGQTGVDAMNVVADSYAVGLVLQNNLLTGWFNPFFFGGGDPPASASGSTTISSRTNTSATLAASPTGSPTLMALQLPFEGNTIGISSISRTSNVVTVVTSSPHNFTTGALVYPKGVTDTSFNATYDPNGAANCIVKGDTGCREITVVNSTTFTYSQTAANSSSSGGVIVPTVCQGGPAYQCFLDVNVDSIAGNVVNFTHGWVSPFAWGTFDALAHNTGLLTSIGGQAQWDGPQVIDADVTQNEILHNTAFDTWVATNNGNISKTCPGESKFWYGGSMIGNRCDGFPVSSIGFNGNTAHAGAPWVRISNIRVEGNYFDRFVGIGFGNFEYDPIAAGDGMYIGDNLWAHPDNTNVTNAAANTYGPNNIVNYRNVTFVHNTILTGYKYSGDTCVTPGANGACYTTKFLTMAAKEDSPFQLPVTPNVIFKDNIIGVGNYGTQCGANGGLAVVGATKCWNTLDEANNMLVANSAGQCVLGSTCPWTANQFPWTNSTGATTPGQPKWQGVDGTFPHAMFIQWSDVGITNPDGGVFALAPSSPGHNGASDGTDVGARISVINSLLGPDNALLSVGGGGGVEVPSKTKGIKCKGCKIR